MLFSHIEFVKLYRRICPERENAVYKVFSDVEKYHYRTFKTHGRWFGIVTGPNGLIGVCAFCESKSGVREDLLARVGVVSSGQNRQDGFELLEDNGLEEELVGKICDYLSGQKVDFGDMRVDAGPKKGMAGKVLAALREIKYGETISYGDLARRCGHPKAARAVGSIMAANPVPIVVPCHRVVRSDGKIGNYMKGERGGREIKGRLLEMERRAVTKEKC